MPRQLGCKGKMKDSDCRQGNKQRQQMRNFGWVGVKLSERCCKGKRKAIESQ